MNIPTDLENIIIDYKHQLDFSKQFDKVMIELQNKNMVVEPLDYDISLPPGQIMFLRIGKDGDSRYIRYFDYGGVYVDNIGENTMKRIE